MYPEYKVRPISGGYAVVLDGQVLCVCDSETIAKRIVRALNNLERS